jgi:Holliday junction resolvase RusA-like endonuclease
VSIVKDVIAFTVKGEPASKANQRKFVHIPLKQGGVRKAFVKSAKALAYEKTFHLQCPEIRPLLEGDLKATITIFYASHRPDLDESVILDCMQARKVKLPNDQYTLVGGVYLNDRQVREKHIFHRIDRSNPRADIRIEKIPPAA